MNRIEEIVWHEAEAERLDQEADGHRWEAASLIAQELANGKSQRELAAEIGKSQTHVSLMAKVWHEWGDYQGNQRPRFSRAYLDAKDSAEKADAKLSPEAEYQKKEMAKAKRELRDIETTLQTEIRYVRELLAKDSIVSIEYKMKLSDDESVVRVVLVEDDGKLCCPHCAHAISKSVE